MSSYGMEAGFETGEYEEIGELAEGGFGEQEEFGEFAEAGEFGEVGSPLSESEQMELAAELLEISSEEELEQFLGGLFKKVSRGVGSFIKSPVGRALGGVLKSVAKKALPVVGGALGSMVAPGVGTAIGAKLGSMAGGLFELEGVPLEQAEYEVARRYVNLAATSMRNAARTRPRPGMHPLAIARISVARAARSHAPGLYRAMVRRLGPGVVRPIGAPAGAVAPPPSASPVSVPPFAVPQGVPQAWGFGPEGTPESGRWVRRGRRILLLGV